jgi:ribosome biogenesis GTPase
MNKKGIIIKGIGGFYYVFCEEDGLTYECKARGIFRRKGITPLAGDKAEFSVSQTTGKGFLTVIEERKNSLVRPPVANIDNLFIVVSTTSPPPNLFVTDKMIATAEFMGIEPLIILTKIDLSCHLALLNTYKKSGFAVFSGDETEKIKSKISGKISAFCGNSGVGKSTLLNLLDDNLSQKTGGISHKLGRGRHTTREVELFRISGGLAADTPGFSDIDVKLDADDAPQLFREFSDYIGECKFRDCRHLKEPDCAITAAVGEGDIAKSRYDSYVQLMTILT